MKMAAIATAITTALVSGSALAAEVYNSDGDSLSIGGRVEFRGDFLGKEDGEKLNGTMANNSRFRINVDGETQITDDLTGLGFYEAEQSVKSTGDSERSENLKQRYLYAGLSTTSGVVTFGRQDAATVQVSQMTDTVTTHSGIQKTYIRAGDEQINNALAYSGYFMDALSVKASYLAPEEANQSGWALSGIYTLPFGLGLGLGYAANDNPGQAQDSKQFIGAVNYRRDGLYLGLGYTKGEGSKKANVDNDFNSIEAVAQYRFPNNFEAVLGYQKGEIDPEGVAEKYKVSDYVEFTGIYYFNKSLRSYATYKLNNLKADSSTLANDADNSLRLGLRYDF